MILFVYRLLPAIFYNISYKTKNFISKFTLRVNSKQGIALALSLFDGSPSNIKMRANLGGPIAIKNACHDVGVKRREAKPQESLTHGIASITRLGRVFNTQK